MSKRGTGSLYLRGRIWWLAWWRDGKPYAESSGSEVREVALDKLKRKLVDRSQVPTRVTMRELFAVVEADYIENDKRSLKDLRVRIKSQLDPAFGNLRADRLTTGAVREFIARRHKQKVSNGTINRETAIIRRALALGAEQEPPLVGRIVKIPRLRENNVRTGFMGNEQYRALLRELPDYLKLILVIAYHTGARKGELLSLRWSQIDRKAKQIRLNPGETKNRQGRVLPIYGDMDSWLDMQRARQRKQWRLSHTGRKATPYPADGWVFTDDHGLLILSFYKAWASACKRAEVPGQLFHDLRRSAARNMRRAGIPEHTIMKIAGWKTPAMFRRYDIVDEADIMEAGRKLGEAMPKAVKEVAGGRAAPQIQ